MGETATERREQGLAEFSKETEGSAVYLEDAGLQTRNEIDPNHVQTLPDDDNDNFRWTISKVLALLSVQLGFLSGVYGLYFTSTLLVPINRDIGPSASYTWMITAQALAVSVTGPTVGRLSDIFGRRNSLIVGNALGLIGCAIAARANSVDEVIGANVLLGIGSALQSLSWAAIGELVPKRARAMALGIFEVSLAPAAAFAPVIAFALEDHASWRWAFWLGFIIDAIAIILLFLFYRPINQYIRIEGTSKLGQLIELDWVGLFLFTAGLLLFLLGISFGGNTYPWKSAGTIAPIVVGLVVLIVLGFWELYTKKTFPLFPRAIFKNIRGFTVVVVAVVMQGMVLYASSFLWPQQIQALYTQDPIKVGFYAGATGMGGCVFGPIAGLLVRYFGRARWFLVFWMTGLALFAGLQAIVSPSSNVKSTALVVLQGGCIASSTIVATSMVQLAVDHQFIGLATSMVISARSVGGSISTTIYTAIFSHHLTSGLPKLVALPLAEDGVAPAQIPGIIEALLNGEIQQLAQVPPKALLDALTGLKLAYTSAFRLVYLVSIAFGVVGIICALWAADVDHLMTKKIDIKLEEGLHIHSHADTGGGHVIIKNSEG